MEKADSDIIADAVEYAVVEITEPGRIVHERRVLPSGATELAGTYFKDDAGRLWPVISCGLARSRTELSERFGS